MRKVLACGKQEFPKLTSCTFEIKYYTRKYVILLKMDQNKSATILALQEHNNDQ